jgi:polar amino acid transport system substrate-binding protein
MITAYKLIPCLCFLLFFLFYSTFSQAQEKITIAVGEWPPYISQDQKHDGVVSHIISDVFSELGINTSIKFLPWSRAYNDTMNGLFSASAIWMDKNERRIDFIYSDAVLVEQFVFFHRKGFPFDWQTLNDLKKINMGGLYASSYGPEVDQALTAGDIQMDRVNRPQQNFKKLLKKRIDIFPFEINVGQSIFKKHLSQHEQEQITHHPKPLLNNYSFVLFPKSLIGSEDLVLRFNKQLQKIKGNGQYEAYFEKLKQGYYDKPIVAPIPAL